MLSFFKAAPQYLCKTITWKLKATDTTYCKTVWQQVREMSKSIEGFVVLQMFLFWKLLRQCFHLEDTHIFIPKGYIVPVFITTSTEVYNFIWKEISISCFLELQLYIYFLKEDLLVIVGMFANILTVLWKTFPCWACASKGWRTVSNFSWVLSLEVFTLTEHRHISNMITCPFTAHAECVRSLSSREMLWERHVCLFVFILVYKLIVKN